MPYTPQTWADLPATTTPISAARLGVIESGIQSGTATAEAAVPKSTGTTKGDLFVATASGVITRLAVSGTNGNVLTEDSTQTAGMHWAPPSGGSTTPSPFAVRVATTSLNGTVTTGPQTVDGVACAFPDRVLYKDSSTPTFNGIYVVQTSGVGWLRSTDMGTGVSVPTGSLLSITEGTVNGGREYQLGSTTPGATGMVIGTNPLTFTQISPNNPPYVTVARSTGQNIYPIPPSGNYYITIDADNPVIVAESLYDNVPRVINLVIQQDATGHPYQFSPSHIAWDNGMVGGTSTWAGAPTPVQFDTSPLTQTIVRLTWLGINYGFYGEILNSLDPLYYNPAISTNFTYSGSGTAWGSVATQAISMNLFVPRNVPAAKRVLYINAMMKMSSAALRTKLFNNDIRLEISVLNSAEGPAGMPDRQLDVNAGGAQYLNRGPNATPPAAAVIPYDPAAVQSNPYPGSGGVDGGVCHELCHALDANYYTGSNPPHSTQGAIPIRNHAALISVYNDCVTNGGPSNNNEWFAELERQRRIADNGSPTSVPPTGSMAVQLGTGTTGNTPAQRWTTWSTYVNGLGLV